MGDNAEFEKLSTLEARLAAALDRIAVGLGEAQAAAPIEDPTLTSGAFEDLQIRAETAEARVSELEARAAQLEAQIAEATTTAQEEAAPDADILAERDAALDRVQALEAAREADRDESHRLLSQRDAEIESLRAALAEAEAQSGAQAKAHAEALAAATAQAEPAQADLSEVEALKARIAEFQDRVTRLRAERAEAQAERDEARDIAEELQAAGGMGPDDRIMALRAEVNELQTINKRLTKNLNRMRGENASDPKLLNKALLVELDAIKATRASEAAELERILADLDGGPAGEDRHA
jgi:hypothetical protein